MVVLYIIKDLIELILIFYWSGRKCTLKSNKEVEECQVTKNGTLYQFDSTDYCQLLEVFRNEKLQLKIMKGNSDIVISYWNGKGFIYGLWGYFYPNDFWNFDWSKGVIHSRNFHKKSIPKDVAYLRILIHGKISFRQNPSREKISFLRGWLPVFIMFFIKK